LPTLNRRDRHVDLWCLGLMQGFAEACRGWQVVLRELLCEVPIDTTETNKTSYTPYTLYVYMWVMGNLHTIVNMYFVLSFLNLEE
jgi:hypothetical protein